MVRRLLPPLLCRLVGHPVRRQGGGMTAMVRRLHERKSETPEGLNLRIATARQEMRRIQEFDYCVVNAQGRAEETVDTILCIMEATRTRVDHKPIVL